MDDRIQETTEALQKTLDSMVKGDGSEKDEIFIIMRELADFIKPAPTLNEWVKDE